MLVCGVKAWLCSCEALFGIRSLHSAWLYIIAGRRWIDLHVSRAFLEAPPSGWEMCQRPRDAFVFSHSVLSVDQAGILLLSLLRWADAVLPLFSDVNSVTTKPRTPWIIMVLRGVEGESDMSVLSWMGRWRYELSSSSNDESDGSYWACSFLPRLLFTARVSQSTWAEDKCPSLSRQA